MEPDYAQRYAGFEQRHWWFRARREILRDQLSRLPWPERPRVLEIGVGPGENLYSLYPPQAELTGVEPDPVLAETARKKGDIPVLEGTAEQLPDSVEDGAWDVITMFDIMEHLDDDVAALQHVRCKLAPGGRLVVSVPACMFLWGQQDTVNQHRRRYNHRQLVQVLSAAGFSVKAVTYFNSLLFPPIALFRVLNRWTRRCDKEAETDFAYTFGPVDALLYQVFRCEKYLLRYARFPIGVSLLAVAKAGDREESSADN